MTNQPTQPGEGYVKVRLVSEDGPVETLWAVRVPTAANLFRLDNAPFFAYGVSMDDVVEGTIVADGFYDFLRVVERSGNRTVRLRLGEERADSPLGTRVLDGIEALGCTYEGMRKTVMSITVPARVDLDLVARYLTSTGLQWEYADPVYEDIVGAKGGAADDAR